MTEENAFGEYHVELASGGYLNLQTPNPSVITLKDANREWTNP